ncbi:hypothetical protein ADH66_00870 [Acutalibacter muris]|uniref:Uncharacterized protein n=2 Tax=Acutalibacter muris TaxID=1796620 RepID=A0ABN4ZZ65_9FIRM|nr:hypothetical protein [Acutalibacter muris]ANU53983.1 hypothetical protein A4V00_08065 [Hungateiclostridiaceae bacterium KB18]ASB39337.1 hypothetical protein ADH66_00870 [Acutalibacter muris]
MNGVYISFYLKANRIHIFVETLRSMDSPRRIRFLISEDGQVLLIHPYDKRGFTSHRIPQEVYDGKRSLEISSYKLCTILAELHGWDLRCSYRVPGRIAADARSVSFFLDKAEAI